MTQQTQATGTAVVIGASMAGLLATRVLSDFYDTVVIVERDALPASPEARKGVPQARHAHALLGHGQQVLEELFPGFAEQLQEQGALLGKGRMFSGGGYLARVADAPCSLYASRPFLEHAVRERVRALPNVSILEQIDVRDLAVDASRARVEGVRVRTRGDDAAERVIAANLVVDASGRGSRTPAWLAALGYPEPVEELVEVNMAYTTRIFRRRPDDLGGDLLVNSAPTPNLTRASAMLALEGDRWLVTVAGYFGDAPPTDDAGFLEFTRSLPAQEIYEMVRNAEPLTEPVTYRFRANQWRHYERLERFPDGFLVIGDAICSFTPIYGQGMTVAALESLALRDCLTQGTDRLAQRFFKRAAKVIAIPWSITVGNDRKLSPATAPRDPFNRALGWYLARFLVAARTDATLAGAFMRVGNLFDPPTALLRPSLALRVLRGGRTSAPHQPEPVAHHEQERQAAQI